MKTDRNWIALGLLAVLIVLAAGCGPKEQPVVAPPPPPPVTPTPPQEVAPEPETRPSDVVEAPPPKSAQDIEADARRRGLLGDVFYDFDRYDVRPEARERLAKNAEFMNSAEGRDLTFTLEGHCDERGTNEYNLALGQRRATAALDYLIELGVARNRFKTVSYGEERFLVTGTGG